MSLNDDVDGWIAQLMQCKPLSENEVKKLCDKVGLARGYCCTDVGLSESNVGIPGACAWDFRYVG